MRRCGGLCKKLLREQYHRADIFRDFCSDGAIRTSERRCRCTDETSGGKSQTGDVSRQSLYIRYDFSLVTKLRSIF